MIRKRIFVKIKFKVVSRKALFFLLNTGITSWAKVTESHKNNNMHGKTKSEYMTLISTFVELVTKIPTNPEITSKIRDRLIRNVAFINSKNNTLTNVSLNSNVLKRSVEEFVTLSQTASQKNTIIHLNDADPKSKSFPFDTKT